MKYFNILLFFGIIFTCNLNAQEALAEPEQLNDSTLVHQCILNLFDGMRESDSTKVHRCFRDDVRLMSSFTTKKGEEILAGEELINFLEAVGAPKDVIWDERLLSVTIQVDDHMAQVWTPYEFYVGEEFSHCGVNAFQLVKADGAWKILNLMDTRRRRGCK